MSYDPNDCELGICGPCETCQEQMDLREELGENATLEDYDNQMKPSTPPPTEKTPIGTIDCTPSWEAVVSIYLELLTSEGADYYKQADAKREIMRAAKLADLYMKEHKR